MSVHFHSPRKNRRMAYCQHVVHANMAQTVTEQMLVTKENLVILEIVTMTPVCKNREVFKTHLRLTGLNANMGLPATDRIYNIKEISNTQSPPDLIYHQVLQIRVMLVILVSFFLFLNIS